MATEDPSTWDTLHTVLAASGAFIMWQFKRLIGRVDEAEKVQVPRSEFNATISSLRTEIKDGNTTTHRRLDELMRFLVEQKGH